MSDMDGSGWFMHPYFRLPFFFKHANCFILKLYKHVFWCLRLTTIYTFRLSYTYTHQMQK